MSKLQDLAEQFRAAQRRMQDEGKDALKEAFVYVFEKYPKLQEVSWEQYTPYFNDGEPCEFSVGSPHLEYEGSEYDYYAPYRAEREPDVYPEGFAAAYEEIDEIFKAVPEALMLSVFDDHVRVTVNREGFTVEGYEHE